jgi:SPP1 family predicted phage head-tail adaptor
MPAKGREFFAAGQLQAEGAMAWRIRYRTDLTAAMRVLEGATPYDIVAVVPSANREWVDLYCTQGVKDGR